MDAITDFLNRTGRAGYLAIEFRPGAGKQNEAYLIPWGVVVDYFRTNRGIGIDDARKGIALVRLHGTYILETLNAK